MTDQIELAPRPASLGRILVEDERECDRIVSYLPNCRWTSVGVGARDLGHQLTNGQHSLITINTRLRSRDALDVLREIRSRSHVPVIMYDANRDDVVYAVVGLELCADDVITGTLNLKELAAHARAVLRRQELARLNSEPLPGGYLFNGWEMRHAERTLVPPEGTPVDLTKGKYGLLAALLAAPCRSLARIHLLRATRTHDDIFDRSVDVQVLRLRGKLSISPGGTDPIRTERGFGYRLEANVESLF
ncbi:winged helix-turn-helix domain-containing protein [Sphingomonas arantia]|uniref:Winged helix-turn-helix domain-containing protein n=1 Tax=Sphingomonas arantia TaxID=1460676 RepID=A0ABW4TZU1_9SPHN